MKKAVLSMTQKGGPMTALGAALQGEIQQEGVEVRSLHPLFAAEIIGLDLAQPADAASVRFVIEALGRHGVLVFRDQGHVTAPQQIAFSANFGPLEIHVQKTFLLKGHPEILIVSNVVENGVPQGLVDAGHYWHSDLSYRVEPSLGSLLHLKERPAEGGDTLFASLAAAYDELGEAMKARLSGLTAVHDYNARNSIQAAKSEGLRPALTADQARTVPPAIHPVVRRHETSGEPLLFVNEGFTTRIVELDEAESSSLLAELFAHQKNPRFHYRHQWRDSDLLFWDNRSTSHLATGTPPNLRRTLYRTTIRGPVPTAYRV
ncbi:MAG TPA: TauD/TfdA family dioxygenase [Beijerinckia sp.]|nr:TauD/TfdA family dioxygenase [Beijerinckia sp.]